jgi:hypothetical protein
MSNMPLHTKHAKTCSIKPYIFIIIVMKQICIPIRIFSNALKKKHANT